MLLYLIRPAVEGRINFKGESQGEISMYEPILQCSSQELKIVNLFRHRRNERYDPACHDHALPGNSRDPPQAQYLVISPGVGGLCFLELVDLVPFS